jgi:rhodanese-related sulfurtransferase
MPDADPERPNQICRECTVEEIIAFLEKYNNDPDLYILDIRQPEEYTSGWIANARNLNYSDPLFRERVAALDRTKRYIIYCRRGMRASVALEIMRECGFLEVYSIRGGIEHWQARGFPIRQQ